MNAENVLTLLKKQLPEDSGYEDRHNFLDTLKSLCQTVSAGNVDNISLDIFIDEARAFWKERKLRVQTFDSFEKNEGLRKITPEEATEDAQEEWPMPVHLPTLLNAIVRLILDHMDMTKRQATTVAVWVVHSWAYDAVDIFPILSISSPTKGCGKTTLVNILENLVREPVSVSGCTMAYIYRRIEQSRPTMMIDEADSFLGKDKEKIGIINSGWKRGGAYGLTELVGDKHVAKDQSTWCPKVLAGIGQRPSTLIDRSIPILLQKKRPGKTLKNFRIKQLKKDTEHLRQKLARWTTDNFDELEAMKLPFIPKDLDIGRIGDNWSPLFAIADLADELPEPKDD